MYSIYNLIYITVFFGGEGGVISPTRIEKIYLKLGILYFNTVAKTKIEKVITLNIINKLIIFSNFLKVSL